jgi:hypothetical protein
MHKRFITIGTRCADVKVEFDEHAEVGHVAGLSG